MYHCRIILDSRNDICPLEGNGDFRNQECIDLLKEADIVVTNPPFSIAREDFIPQLFEYKKKFLIIGDLNWVTYKIIFPLLKNNEMWMGYSAVKEFLQPDGTIKKFGNKLWFTNLDIKNATKNSYCGKIIRRQNFRNMIITMQSMLTKFQISLAITANHGK